ncbi:hypothetical protein F4802DRAFT_544837 [Xylaria palmicola]|nr:hypothetical protein F4802DRAFT_544837 [Xylaria palmicola]
MADLQKPAQPKRALPFKRTARPKPSSDATPSADDDGLALFSQSKNYFPTVVEDQQRRAREKAEQAERERNEELAREREEKERKAREAQWKRGQRRKDDEEEASEGESARKRRRLSFPSDGDGPEGDSLADKPSKPHKPSTPFSPPARRHAPSLGSSPATGSAPTTRQSRRLETPIILLDGSDDDDTTERGPKTSTTSSRRQSGGSQNEVVHVDDNKGKARADDSDSDLEVLEAKGGNKQGAEGEGEGEGEEEEEDPSEFYIKAAMERMRKSKEARLARESSAAAGGEGDKNKSATPGLEDDRGSPVSVMIAAPALPEAKVLCCTVRTAQALQIAFDTFKERQKSQTAYPHKMVSELVFTWRGDRVYDTTKLETLGIYPRGRDGRLHDNTNSGRGAPEGYVGRDKVYFEAWTPEAYGENQQKRERERKRREMGEWWDEDEDDSANDKGRGGAAAADGAEAATPPKEDDRVRVIFKARDMPPRNVTLRKHSTVEHMIRAFRKLAGLGEDRHVEIRWDGEVLDLETTVEEADIADMDSVEVHVR